MTIAKAAGLCLVFVSITAAGLYIAEGYRAECGRLRAFLRLISHIRVNIAEYRMPLGEIYEAFGDGAPELDGFTELMRADGFETALDMTLAAYGLSDAAGHALREFASGLGMSAAEEQVRRCEICESVLAEALKNAESALPSRLRLCRTLSLAFAAAAVILIL